VYYPLCAAVEAGATRVVVVVSPETEAAIEAAAKRFGGVDVVTMVQHPPRGTGDAARVGLEAVTEEEVLILCGDTPLLRAPDLKDLLTARRSSDALLSFMSCVVEDPTGYGRVLRGEANEVLEIREHRDLETEAERSVREVNAGVYAANTKALRDALARLTPDNAQAEYYLTDVVADLARRGLVLTVAGNGDALVGVNDRAQLSHAERRIYQRTADELAQSGVTVRGDVYVDGSVKVAAGATLEPGVRLRGQTSIGEGAYIDVGCVIDNSTVAANAKLLPYSVMTDSQVGEGAQIGPFAHLRPGSEIGPEAKVGNFCETKKTKLRRGAKVNHLSYVGDADVGERVNIGAGTIFCNYDGFKKHKTVIGEGSFIGSDSQLIAPVNVGAHAYVATGTSVTQDVPDDAMAIGRSRQVNKPGYASKLRERLRGG
jgi:bifunctional UDP-N-acetylglucosamine pyrophosphorylase/glucosamine-1-phosphate N-acetyltransferase